MDDFALLTRGCKFTKNKLKPNGSDEVNIAGPVAVKSSMTNKRKAKNFFELLEQRQQKQKEEEGNEEVKQVKLVDDMEGVNLRKKFKIFADGSDVPQLVLGFDDLKRLFNFNQQIVDNIHLNLKFTNLTPVQMQVIPAMLHRREVMVCAPTGSGKTLSFILPALHHLLTTKKKMNSSFRALVVCPTRELALQIHKVCTAVLTNSEGERSGKLSSLKVQLLDKKCSESCKNKGLKHSKSWDMLISTPNSVAYLLEDKKLSLDSVEWLIVDESDKMFESSNSKNEDANRSFREQLGVIYRACVNPLVRRAVFSATYAHDVQQWCLLNMNDVIQITVGGRNTAVESVDQKLQYVGNEAGKRLAIRQLKLKGFKPPTLIFVQSKQRAKDLYNELVYDELNVDVIHADRTPLQREQSIIKFRKAQTWVLICTEILGRGIDILGCNLVINYDLPTSAVSYIHRIGRTGRAGRRGEAITYFTDDDKPHLRTIANVIKQAGCPVPHYLLELKKVKKEERRELAKRNVKRETVRSTPACILNKKRKNNNDNSRKGNKKKKNNNKNDSESKDD